jgi:hypothetical protein
MYNRTESSFTLQDNLMIGLDGVYLPLRQRTEQIFGLVPTKSSTQALPSGKCVTHFLSASLLLSQSAECSSRHDRRQRYAKKKKKKKNGAERRGTSIGSLGAILWIKTI